MKTAITAIAHRVNAKNVGPQLTSNFAQYFVPNLPVSKIFVDTDHQRKADKGEITKIAKDFSAKYFGAVTVVKLDDNTYVACDGQQRCIAAIKRGITEVPALVIVGDQQDIGKIFLNMNEVRKRVSEAAKFLNRVNLAKNGGGYAKELGLYNLAINNGFVIDEDNVVGKRTIQAVREFKNLASIDEKSKDPNYTFTVMTLAIFRNVWPHDNPIGVLLHAIGKFLWAWDPIFKKGNVSNQQLINFFRWYTNNGAGKAEQHSILESTKDSASNRYAVLVHEMSDAYNKYAKEVLGKKRAVLCTKHIGEMKKNSNVSIYGSIG